jgi:hypothetical protein
VSDTQKNEYGDTYIVNRDKKKNVRFLNGLNTMMNVHYTERKQDDDTIMLDVTTFETKNDFKKHSFHVQNLEETNGYRYYSKAPGRGGQMKMLLGKK